jgi:hypothetical protein
MPRIEVPVQATVVGDVTVNPNRLHYGVVKPGSTATRECRILSQAKKPIEIEKIDTRDLPIEVSVKDEIKGGIILLTVKLNAPEKTGLVRGTVYINVKNDKEPLKLYLTANVR